MSHGGTFSFYSFVSTRLAQLVDFIILGYTNGPIPMGILTSHIGAPDHPLAGPGWPDPPCAGSDLPILNFAQTFAGCIRIQVSLS